MGKHSWKTIAGIGLTLLLAIPAAGHAQAQDTAQAGGPEIQHYENVPYLTGGITLDERQTLQEIAAKENFNLKVIVASAEGSFLSDVKVRVTDSEDTLRLKARTDGPWLYARLPPGNYRIEGTREGSTRTASVSLTGTALREVVLRIP